jgi:hypothetical protein
MTTLADIEWPVRIEDIAESWGCGVRWLKDLAKKNGCGRRAGKAILVNTRAIVTP